MRGHSGGNTLRFFARLFIALAAVAGLSGEAPAQTLPRSILVLDQSGPNTPWPLGYNAALRATLRTGESPPIAIYSEILDLGRFQGSDYEKTLFDYLQRKYHDAEIGIVVVHGVRALEFYLRVREKLWPNAPVVAALFDVNDVSLLRAHENVTGTILRFRFDSAVKVARAIVPNFKRLVLVGDHYERQPFRRHYAEERKKLADEVEFIDLLGLPMTEVKERVAALPPDSAIFYTEVYRDGAGITFSLFDAIAELMASANRPIIVDNSVIIGLGPTGGIAAQVEPFAGSTGEIVLRILRGEKAGSIPVTIGDFTSPIFDWRQLQRFQIAERNLPANSEIRFKQFAFWELYRWQAIATLGIVLFQAALIALFLIEFRRRRAAETESQRRLLETVHLNRSATAGALSASVAHELNQPLGAILSNTEAAERLISEGKASSELLLEILSDIRRDDQRAGEIIRRLRGLLSKKALEFQVFEFDTEISNVAKILYGDARKRGVVLETNLGSLGAQVRADSVHLQQVLLNVAINGMDAMTNCEKEKRLLKIGSARDGSNVAVTISDNGSGISEEKLKTVFDTFYTTKAHGIGLGLSIARTIIETYGGRIWAENKPEGGAVFHITLPLAEAK